MTQWVGPPDQGFISVAAGGATLISFLSFEEAATLVRVRGAVAFRYNSYAADASIVGAIGIGIVSTEAFTAGIASIPEPYSDGDWGGWMVWRSFAHHFQSITQAGVLLGDMSIEIDSKAMRKVSPNETAVFIAESQSGAYQVADCTRQLIKLS